MLEMVEGNTYVSFFVIYQKGTNFTKNYLPVVTDTSRGAKVSAGVLRMNIWPKSGALISVPFC